MSYFPAYAFFESIYKPEEKIVILINELAQVLNEITISVDAGSKQRAIHFSDQSEALAFLRSSTNIEPISYLYLDSDLHHMEFEFISPMYIRADFWDYSSDLYDQGLTEELKREKSNLALHLLNTFITACHANFAYISSEFDEDSGLDVHNKIANHAFLSLTRNNISDLLEYQFYFWFIGFSLKNTLIQTGESILKTRFKEELRNEEVVIFTDKQNRPYFLK